MSVTSWNIFSISLKFLAVRVFFRGGAFSLQTGVLALVMRFSVCSCCLKRGATTPSSSPTTKENENVSGCKHEPFRPSGFVRTSSCFFGFPRTDLCRSTTVFTNCSSRTHRCFVELVSSKVRPPPCGEYLFTAEDPRRLFIPLSLLVVVSLHGGTTFVLATVRKNKEEKTVKKKKQHESFRPSGFREGMQRGENDVEPRRPRLKTP